MLLKRKPPTNEAMAEKERLDVLTKAHTLCREYLQGGWAKVSCNEIDVLPFGGGLTNKVYICKLPEKFTGTERENKYVPHTVLLRLYGLILHDFKAQIQESVVFSILAERNIGPHLYAVFGSGRMEEYIPCRMLQTKDMWDSVTSRYIAHCVGDYHVLNMPVKKQPTFVTARMSAFLEKVKNMNFTKTKAQKMYKEILAYDLDMLVTYFTETVKQNQGVVVFCHNDVQEGNLMFSNRNERGNPVQMINFDYSSYNLRGYDIGNHFCEWMYDYSYGSWPYFKHSFDNFPTEAQQVAFVKAYLEVVFKHHPEKKQNKKWSVDYILNEAKHFALMSHLFWALWAVVQAKLSNIEFGYLEYAIVRLNDLKRQQNEWGL